MTRLPLSTRFRHLLISSRWQRWLFPVICICPYVAILIWLLTKGLIWIARVLLGSSAHGCCACFDDSWLGESRIQYPFAQTVESSQL